VSVTDSVVVDDAPLTASGVIFGLTEGQTFSGVVATFTDKGTDTSYTASIDWGDGSSSAGTISIVVSSTVVTMFVLGNHTYTDEGQKQLTIQVTDAGGATATALSVAEVADAPLSLTASDFTAGEAQSWNGTVATFSDPGGDSPTYSATIDWGDGSSSQGTIS